MGNCCNNYIRYLILRGTRFFYNDGSDSINPENEDGVEQNAIFTNHNSDSQQPESGIDSNSMMELAKELEREPRAPNVLPQENSDSEDSILTDTQTLTPN